MFIPLSGWVADRFGARTVFRAAIAVFTLGSAACGFAQGLPDLVAFRILQGMGLAPMAVLPEHQRDGIGARLVEEGLSRLEQSGCPFVPH